MSALKKILFDEYGGFADKRIKDIDKGNKFIVDDRDDSDIGANGKLLSYFCMIFVEVLSNEKVFVELYGNIPIGKTVKNWLAKKEYEIKTLPMHSILSIEINQGDQGILKELAESIESIVAPGAPRYNVKSYKYVCPRTAKSLDRLRKILDKAWENPLPSELKGFF